MEKMQQENTHTCVHSTAFDSSMFSAPFIHTTPKLTTTMEDNANFFAFNGQNIQTDDRSWELKGNILDICANFAVCLESKSVELHIRGKGTEGNTSCLFLGFQGPRAQP